MKIKFYKNPKKTGWLGWIDCHEGHCIGFVRLDGTIIFDWKK